MVVSDVGIELLEACSGEAPVSKIGDVCVMVDTPFPQGCANLEDQKHVLVNGRCSMDAPFSQCCANLDKTETCFGNVRVMVDAPFLQGCTDLNRQNCAGKLNRAPLRLWLLNSTQNVS